MSTVLRPDAALIGAAQIIAISTSPLTVAVSSKDTQRVLLLTPTYTPTVSVQSAALSGSPEALISALSALWTVTTNGRLIKLNSSTLATIVDTDIGASRSNWIASTSSTIITAGTPGGIQVFNSSGTRLSRAEGILDEIQCAVATGGYLYAFDGAGNGVTLSISSAGAIAVIGTFTVPNVRGVLRAKIQGTNIVLAGLARQATDIISIATPTAPTVTTLSRSDSGTIASVANDTAATPIGSVQQSVFGYAYWFVADDSNKASDGYQTIHGQSARISVPDDSYSTLVTILGAYFFWRFDETSGTSAADATANARNGTIGSAVTVNQTGHSSRCYAFANNAANSYVELTSASFPVAPGDGSGIFSVGGWFKTSASATQVLAARRSSANGSWQIIMDNTGRIGFNLYDGVAFIYGADWWDHTTATGLNDGAWHHIMCIKSAGTLKTYVDGSLYVQHTGTPRYEAAGQNFHVGNRDMAGGQDPFIGSMDAWGYWNARELSPGDVIGLYLST